MPDTYQKLTPGERLRGPNAALHNITVDMAREYEARRKGQSGSESDQPGEVLILNTSEEIRDQYEVVGLGAVIIDPTEDTSEFRNVLGFESAAPTNTGPFAILQEPLGENETIGIAKVSGATWVQVDFGDSADEFAAPYHNNYTNLVSQAEPGPARVLWKEDGDGLLWAKILLLGDAGSAASGGSIEDEFGATATGPNYVFQTGTDGADFNISAEDSTVTWNMPDAYIGVRGIVKGTGFQTFGITPSFNTSVLLYSDSGTTGGIFHVVGSTIYTGWGVSEGGVSGDIGANLYLYAISTGFANTTLVLWGTGSGPTDDTQPCYAVRVGLSGTLYTGAYGTDSIGNVFKGGLVTTIGSGGFSSVLFTEFADAGNSTTSETDLFSHTIAAGQLADDGDTLDATYAGTCVLHVTALRRVRIYFGGTLIYDSTAQATTNGLQWKIVVTVMRESSSVVRCAAMLTWDQLPGAFLGWYGATYTRVTGLTLSNTQVLKITGTASGAGAATDDIVGKLARVEYKPA